MSSKKVATQVVRPIISVDKHDARLRVLRLYRLWYRQIHFFKWAFCHFVPITEEEMKQKIRSEFYKHKDETDLRVIDMLIFRGQQDFREVSELWSQDCHVMGTFFNENTNKPQPKFLEKFFTSKD